MSESEKERQGHLTNLRDMLNEANQRAVNPGATFTFVSPTFEVNEKGVPVPVSIVPVKESEKVKQDTEIREKLLETLADLGKLTVGEDDLVFEGTRFVLPETMAGDVAPAIKFLRNWQEQQEQTFSFQRTFNYRPYDGAHAFQLAMKKMWGTTGLGKDIKTMFGNIPPEYQQIDIGPNETTQVPWNLITFGPLSAEFYLMATENEYGQVFQLSVEAPRKYRAHIEAFFSLVERELQTNSIYKGKAITGAHTPKFINLSTVDPKRVIYSEDVMIQFETNMWSLLRYSDEMRKHNIPLKRAVLVEGPYGTGKTLGGLLTAKEAVDNGWTFIQARPGDNLRQVLATAQLYAPSVVWYEDIDTIADGQGYGSINDLLDALDGVTNKGHEVLAGFTTNFVERIHKGVLRPGRLDALIHVGDLDRAGFERLVKVTMPARSLRDDIDYDRVAEAFQGFVPAFAKEAIDRSVRYSMTRNGGVPGPIGTEDLVDAANGLRPQLEQMERAGEGVQPPSMDAALRDLVNNTQVERAGGKWAQLSTKGNGNGGGGKDPLADF